MNCRICKNGFSVDVSDKSLFIPADKKIQKMYSGIYFVCRFKLKISMKWVSDVRIRSEVILVWP